MAKKKPYQKFGPLPEGLREALERDIKARGVQVPVELDDQGNVLDGHNRVEIAEKHGIPWRDTAIIRTFETEEQKEAHVIALNLLRRQMPDVAWGRAFMDLCEHRGAKLGKGKGNPHAKESKTATVAVLAAECGVSERTARNRVAKAKQCETRRDKVVKATSATKATSTKKVRGEIGDEDRAIWDNLRGRIKTAWERLGSKQHLAMVQWTWKRLSQAERATFKRWAKL